MRLPLAQLRRRRGKLVAALGLFSIQRAPVGGDVHAALRLAYRIPVVVQALDLDQCGVVHIAVLIFAIAADEESVE
jgi:hypothetical protein